jgi:hypothetical protein
VQNTWSAILNKDLPLNTVRPDMNENSTLYITQCTLMWGFHIDFVLFHNCDCSYLFSLEENVCILF